VVGIVVVSHSAELAHGVAAVAGQMAPNVRIEAAGGAPGGGLGTDEGLVRAAIERAEAGDGVVVLVDLGSSVLTVRHLLAQQAGNHVTLADAPLVEGAISAAVIASAGGQHRDVVQAAEEARNAHKL
jgi:phosphoenolpyruvate---glycerone phosphotransferase subunit DhaM